MKMNFKKIKRYIAGIMILAVLLSLGVTGCAENDTTDPSGTKEDMAVIGSVESQDSQKDETAAKRVAITYDDGPHNVRTKKIVDELEKYGFHATFFVVGNRVDGSEYNGAAGLKYAYEKGNEIAIHGYTHSYSYDKCSDEDYKSELSKTQDAIKDVIGVSAKLMRPIGGAITSERIKTCQYAVIKWDVDSEDWRHKYSDSASDENAEEKLNTIVENVMSSVRDGSIILMHDIYESTYEATVIILERLHAEGYEVVSVSELLGEKLCAGKSFSSGR